MRSPKIGIDFGTSNSTCAVLHGEEARLIPLEGKSTTLPSAIFFGKDGSIYYGRKSFSAYLEGEEGRFMRGLKSILGTSLMIEKTLINKRYVDFTDIITIYMRHIKERAEEYTGEKVADIVLGRPVHFHDNDPQADISSENTLREIAGRIGFKDISFQYEPIAAAFAHERALKKDQLAFVADLGGGTSDFTVIRLSPQRSIREDRTRDILATSGVRIGGSNFDQKLSMKSFMPYLGLGSEYRSGFDKEKILPIPPAIYYQLSDWPQINSGQTGKAINETRTLLRMAEEPEKLERLLRLQESGQGHAFLQAVERTKIALTDYLDLRADLSEVNVSLDIEVSRAEFEGAVAQHIERISVSIDQCLKETSVEKDSIGLVILTGGSSELPIVKHMVMDKFSAAEISNDNTFGSVGLGLAYSAGRVSTS